MQIRRPETLFKNNVLKHCLNTVITPDVAAKTPAPLTPNRALIERGGGFAAGFSFAANFSVVSPIINKSTLLADDKIKKVNKVNKINKINPINGIYSDKE